MYSGMDDLDATATLAATQSNLRARRAEELEGLLLVGHWADLHAGDPQDEPDAVPIKYGGDKLVRLGGVGTPKVAELCLPELAIARSVHTLSARAITADVLDLRHRLPLIWAVVQDLGCEVWVARRVASLTRDLSPEAALIVDKRVGRAIQGESPGRVIRIAEAAVIEADLAAHAAKLDAERRRRYVGLSRTDEHGLRQIIARIDAGDAVWVDAMVDRVADILATRPDLRPDTPTEISKDELRSIAFGWLARPAELLTLLLENVVATDEADDADVEDEAGEAPEVSRAIAVPEKTLGLMASTDLTKLRPRTTLYVHLHQGAVDGTTGGVARVEGIGPMLMGQVTGLLAHTNVIVKPVIDLHDQVSVNAYEHPRSVRERVHLRSPGEVFPHATRISRRLDLDHPAEYQPHGPPGQTGDHNAGPLGRTNHRAKTQLGYTVKQTSLNEYLWSTPHGLNSVVDDEGTHPIDSIQAAELANPGWLDRALDRLMREHGLPPAACTIDS